MPRDGTGGVSPDVVLAAGRADRPGRKNEILLGVGGFNHPEVCDT